MFVKHNEEILTPVHTGVPFRQDINPFYQLHMVEDSGTAFVLVIEVASSNSK